MKLVVHLPHESKEMRVKLAHLVRMARLELCETFTDEELTMQLESTGNGHDTIIMCSSDSTDLIRIVADRFNRAMIILFLFDVTFPHLAKEIAQFMPVRCFVATHHREFDPTEISTLLNKISEMNIFGIEWYLGAKFKPELRLLKRKADKASILQAIEDYIFAVKGERAIRLARHAVDVADELMLNAIFDANPRLLYEPRNSAFELSEFEVVEVRWGIYNDIFAVSVADPFGSLRRDTVVRYLDDSLTLSQSIHETSTGLGFRTVFDKIQTLIINVEFGVRTEAISLISSNTGRCNPCRRGSLHYFSKQD